MVLECATYLTLEFPSTENQHTPLWVFVFVFCHWFFFFFNFSPKVVFLFVHEAGCSERGPSLSSLCRETRSWGRSEHPRLLLSCGWNERRAHWALDGKSANGCVLSTRAFVKLTNYITCLS